MVFHYAQEVCEVHTMDISRSGGLIRTPVSFPSGTLLILECAGLCDKGSGVRLLARVVRSSRGSVDQKSGHSGLGLTWVRAYSGAGRDVLREFLADKLGYEPFEVESVSISPAGDAVYDFPAALASIPRTTTTPPSPLPTARIAEYQEQRSRLMSLQKDRFRVETSVVYSVHNMHYRGTLIALGPEGLAVSTRGALPFLFAKVVVRYPLEPSPTSPRIILFCETDFVLEPFGREPGFFSARTLGIDELDSPGIFKMHMRVLGNRYPKW